MRLKFIGVLVMALAVVAVGLSSPATTVSASHVDPVIVEPWDSGNALAECDALGFPYGAKKDDPTSDSGFGIGDGMLIDYTFNVVGGGSELNTVNWTSNLGIDAVVMKASNAANVYYYDPESTGDTGLVTPLNTQGGPRGISHITFCWDRELTVSKTVDSADYTHDHNWDIDKTV